MPTSIQASHLPLTSAGSAQRGWLGYSRADRVPGTKWKVYRGQQIANLDTILFHCVAQNHSVGFVTLALPECS